MNNMNLARFLALLILFTTSSVSFANGYSSAREIVFVEGTKWKFDTEITLVSSDVLRMVGDYTFAKNGKVGAAYERELYGWRRRGTRYDILTGRYEDYYGDALISSLPVNEIGTYKLNGSSIHLEFNSHYVDATIKDNRMEGFIVLKPNKEPKKWVAERVLETNNTPSSSGNRKSKPRNSSEIESDLFSSSVKLNPGTYVGEASQSSTASRDGFTVTDILQISIKIESIDTEGNIKAVIDLGNNRGNVSGRVDSEGKLQLEGSLFNPFLGGSRQFYLTATVKGTSLTAGKYTSNSPGTKSTGEFNKAVLEK